MSERNATWTDERPGARRGPRARRRRHRRSRHIHRRRPPRHVPAAAPRRPGQLVGRGPRRRAGFWAVTRHADLLTVSRNVDTFSSAQGIRLEEMDAEETEARRTMMELDPPEHTAYRRLVSKPFSRREVYAYEQRDPRARPIGHRRGARRRAAFDFVDRIAKQLPMRMLGALLGVPDERRSVARRARRRPARQHRSRVHHAPRRSRRHRGVPPDAVPQPGRHRAVRYAQEQARAGGATRPTTSSATCCGRRSTARC